MRALRTALLATISVASSLAGVPAAGAADATWTGIYIGGHVAGGKADIDWLLDYPYGTDPGRHHAKIDDIVGGGQIGIQRQFGRWVVGGELGLTGALGSKAVTGLDLYDPAVGTLRAELDWLVTATSRVGYTFGDCMVYGKAGYAGAMINLMANDHVAPEWGFETRKMHNGWTAGIGVERIVMGNLIVGVEYAYTDLGGNVRTPVLEFPDTPLGTDAVSRVDTVVHSVMARLSLRLGRAPID